MLNMLAWLILSIILIIVLILPLIILRLITKKACGARISGQHVMITGGSQGIGLELAKQCAAQGADVTILARNEVQLNAAKTNIEKCRKYVDSQRVQTVSCDLSTGYETVEEAVRTAEKTFGEVDVLINCAGLAKCKYFEDFTISEFKTLMDVNYYGSLYAIKAVLDNMKRRKSGTIALVSSQGGQVGFIGMSGYSPSKFAVRGLAESLLSELLPFNINVAVVYPPDTDTPGFAVENQDKVIECQEISETAGLMTPNYVASQIISGLQNGVFSINIGIDGLMLDTVSCGLTPFPGFYHAFIQVYLIGIFRLIGLFYAVVFQRIVLKHKLKRHLYDN